ncbi:hypothetical protein EYR38_002398 [Pleurotus pulmonarius]|nr:hypothetical protein EYR38_002398 [Pleurotus pulmonarius]
MVVVFPTKGLEEQMETRFKALGISAVAINEDTLASARRVNKNLWTTAITSSIVLLSPEQLISPSFSTLLTKRAFTSRLCALGVDEMHLVNDWGDPDFREAFRRIGHVLARLPPKTTFIGVTATLLAGIDTSQLISTLGLPPDSYFFQRRSNVRRDMRNIFRILRHGLAGWTFPDLDWIAHSQRKTIVYCETINLGFHLSIYFRQIAPHKRVRRLYNSMCFPSHNIATCQTFVDDPNVGIIIATDAMVVGFDFPNVDDVVILGCAHPNRDVQCKGRTGRPGGHVRNPRGITYVTKAMLANAQKLLRQQDLPGKTSHEGRLHPGMAALLLAPTGCHNTELDILYGNPESDPACRRCTADILPSLPVISRASAKAAIRMNERLTDTMRRRAFGRLVEFRKAVWHSEGIQTSPQYIPPAAILPDGFIKSILDRFARITTIKDVEEITVELDLLRSHQATLFIIIMELRSEFAIPMPLATATDLPPMGSLLRQPVVSGIKTSEVTMTDGTSYTVTIQQPMLAGALASTSRSNQSTPSITIRPHKRKSQAPDEDAPSTRRAKHNKENVF